MLVLSTAKGCPSTPNGRCSSVSQIHKLVSPTSLPTAFQQSLKKKIGGNCSTENLNIFPKFKEPGRGRTRLAQVTIPPASGVHAQPEGDSSGCTSSWWAGPCSVHSRRSSVGKVLCAPPLPAHPLAPLGGGWVELPIGSFLLEGEPEAGRTGPEAPSG